MPDDRPGNPTGIAQSTIKKATVTLPEGMTINPSAGEGLGACTRSRVRRGRRRLAAGRRLPQRLQGRHGEDRDAAARPKKRPAPSTSPSPYENPFDSLLALYIVAKIPDRGVLVKVAGKVKPDPTTGQLTTTFDDLPQLPFCNFTLAFREGQRSPLITPPACGTYTTDADFIPWSARPDNPAPRSQQHLPDRPGRRRRPLPAGGPPPFNPAARRHAQQHRRLLLALLRAPHPQRRRTGDHPLLDQAAAGADRQARRHPLLLRRGDRQPPRRRPAREEHAEPVLPAGSQVGRTLVGAGVGSVYLRPRQGLPRRPLPRRPALGRRDHRRHGRALRPRHRRRPRRPSSRPRNRRSLRRRRRLGPDPPHPRGDPAARPRHPRLHRPARLHPQPDQLRPDLDRSDAARLGPRLRQRGRRLAVTVTEPFQAADCAAPRLQAEARLQPQGRHQARRLPGLHGDR